MIGNNAPPPVAAVILAAGRGTRFAGGDKLAAPFGSGTVLSTVLTAVLSSLLQDVVLVTTVPMAVVPIPPNCPFRIADPGEPSAGLSQSIKAGIEALDPDVAGAMIVLGDMPLVTTDLIDALIARFIAEEATKIVYPENAKSEQGHPVIWPRSFFPALMALSGDTGAKSLLRANAASTAPLRISDAGAFADIDTRADYERVLALKSL